MADTTQPAGALPEPIHERCKFAAGGARCAKHCGDTVCLPPEIVDTVVLARLNASIAWMMEGKSPGPLGCVGVGDMKRLVTLMADRDAWRDKAHRTDLLAEKLMAERDAARAQSEHWAKSVDALRDERDALRRELGELRAQPACAYLRSLTHPDWIETCQSDAPGAFPAYARPIPPDAREGREPQWQPMSSAPKDGTVVQLLVPSTYGKWAKELSLPGRWFETMWISFNVDEAISRVDPTHWHRIGPAGTSADGETQP